MLPISHDEVVHGKGSLWERMPGDAWNKAAGLRALLAYMWAHPGKQLLFQGGEFGQEREWSEQRPLDWFLLDDPLHGGIKALVGDMNRAYRSMPALWTRDATPDGFSWIDANDSSGNVLSFLRHGVDADGKPTVLACIANFSGSPKPDYRVGLPFAGRWREVLNTDAESYGGSGWGNYGGVDAEQYVWHGRPASAVLQLPPAGVLWLAPEPFEGAVRRSGTASASAPSDATRTGPIAVVPAAEPDDAVTLAPAGGAATPTSAPSPAPSDETPTPPTGLPITPPAPAADTSPGSEADASPTAPAYAPPTADASPGAPADASPIADASPASPTDVAPSTRAAEASPTSSADASPTTATSASPSSAAAAPSALDADEPTAPAPSASPGPESEAPFTSAADAPPSSVADAPSDYSDALAPTSTGDASAAAVAEDAPHPPEADLESGADPEPTTTAGPADEPTVSIPASWGGETTDLPRQDASDEATLHIPAREDPAADRTPAQLDDEATETVEDSSDDSDEGPGSAHRNKTAQ